MLSSCCGDSNKNKIKNEFLNIPTALFSLQMLSCSPLIKKVTFLWFSAVKKCNPACVIDSLMNAYYVSTKKKKVLVSFFCAFVGKMFTKRNIIISANFSILWTREVWNKFSYYQKGISVDYWNQSIWYFFCQLVS